MVLWNKVSGEFDLTELAPVVKGLWLGLDLEGSLIISELGLGAKFAAVVLEGSFVYQIVSEASGVSSDGELSVLRGLGSDLDMSWSGVVVALGVESIVVESEISEEDV